MRIPFLSRIFRSRASPENSLWGSAYSFFFGTTPSGKTVNERTAMQTTAVYACVRVLAEAIASLPLHTYRYMDKGKEKALDHNLYYLLHSEPNPEMTSFVFRETLMDHLLLWGNAYAQIIRDGRGKVVALYPLLPDKMTVDRTERGELFYLYNKEGINYSLRSDEVLHIPGLGFDGLVGYSPIAMEPRGRFLRLHELHELVYVAVISQRCNIWKVKKLAVSKTVGQANGISRSIILKP